MIANQGVTRCVNEVGIGFMMSPKYHPAMKIVSPVRKKLKVKTVFNVLGPMLNPAQVPFAVVGVYTEDLVSFFLGNCLAQNLNFTVKDSVFAHCLYLLNEE